MEWAAAGPAAPGTASSIRLVCTRKRDVALFLFMVATRAMLLAGVLMLALDFNDLALWLPDWALG